MGPEPWRGVVEIDTDRVEQLQLGALAYHVDQALFAGGPAGECGSAIKRVDRRAEIVTAGLPPSKLRTAVPLARYIKQFDADGKKK